MMDLPSKLTIVPIVLLLTTAATGRKLNVDRTSSNDEDSDHSAIIIGSICGAIFLICVLCCVYHIYRDVQRQKLEELEEEEREAREEEEFKRTL